MAVHWNTPHFLAGFKPAWELPLPAAAVYCIENFIVSPRERAINSVWSCVIGSPLSNFQLQAGTIALIL
jgi:hypothetical protein